MKKLILGLTAAFLVSSLSLENSGAMTKDYTKYVEKYKQNAKLNSVIGQAQLANFAASVKLLWKDALTPKDYMDVKDKLTKAIKKNFQNGDSAVLVTTLAEILGGYGGLQQSIIVGLEQVYTGCRDISTGTPNDRTTGRKVTNGIGSLMIGTEALKAALDLYAPKLASDADQLARALQETRSSRHRFDLGTLDISKQINREKSSTTSQAAAKLIEHTKDLIRSVESDEYPGLVASLKKLIEALETLAYIADYEVSMNQIAGTYHSGNNVELETVDKILAQLRHSAAAKINRTTAYGKANAPGQQLSHQSNSTLPRNDRDIDRPNSEEDREDYLGDSFERNRRISSSPSNLQQTSSSSHLRKTGSSSDLHLNTFSPRLSLSDSSTSLQRMDSSPGLSRNGSLPNMKMPPMETERSASSLRRSNSMPDLKRLSSSSSLSSSKSLSSLPRMSSSSSLSSSKSLQSLPRMSSSSSLSRTSGSEVDEIRKRYDY
ncbi:MAG: hypothetical protein LBJ45_01595 [Holosporaceae bacterium]|jgi:hypothetical protein|nr:hypothetical protein [Holosporaceae bacterium]